MEIIKYHTELDLSSRQAFLVKDSVHEYGDNTCNSPEKVLCLMNELFHLNVMAEEYCYMISLNTKCRITGVMEISHGTVDSSMISPREVFQMALLANASGIIVVHNHPSQIPTPSVQDLDVMERLNKAGELIGVPVKDFIIIGGTDYFSASETGYIK